MVTNKGDREINEDSIGMIEEKNKLCFVLCDGLGGHGMGDVASSLVVDEFKSKFSEVEDIVSFLKGAFSASEIALLKKQQAMGAAQKMKTTAVAIAMNDNNAYIGHIGDSRAYVFSHNKVYKRTLDHSIPQMLVLSGEIKEREIRHHPERNYVLRVLGVPWDEPMYELMDPMPLNKCNAFLLCSDGFWELIEEKDMCRLLKKSVSANEWLEKMTAIVQQNGKGTNMDNYSAIAIWCR